MSIHYNASDLSTSKRNLPSDPLALHLSDSNIIFAGLRSGNVLLEDLRVDTHVKTTIASTKKGKAVVGVKRLKDSAVPFGLVVSGLGDEVSPDYNGQW